MTVSKTLGCQVCMCLLFNKLYEEYGLMLLSLLDAMFCVSADAGNFPVFLSQPRASTCGYRTGGKKTRFTG